MLSIRLQRACALIPYGTACVADIGCDHGFLSRELIVRNGVKKVIAVDISPQSLEKARLLAEHHNLESRIITRCGFGLRPISRSEADIAVIAGMGGGEIIKILSDSERADGIEKFILLPHKDVTLLREYLSGRTLIVSDRTIKDKGKFYDLIETAPGAEKLTETEIYFNKSDISAPSLDFIERLGVELSKAHTYGARATGERKEYFEKRVEIMESIIDSMRNVTMCNAQ